MNYKELLTQFGNKLNDYAKELGSYGIDSNIITDVSKNCEFKNNIWSYPSRPIKFILSHEDIPNHTVPKLLKEYKATLEIDLIITGDIKINLPQNSINDPINSIKGFDIVVTTNGYVSSWHLDRHEVQPNNGRCDYIHPIYHFTHGGHKMEGYTATIDDYFGNAIIMRNPRLMHPPMDLILGIDFIFNQFIPNKKLSILSDKAYIDIVNQVKVFLWRPFALAIAKNYCSTIAIDGNIMTFNNEFVKSTISC
jgi:hypothetical protein